MTPPAPEQDFPWPDDDYFYDRDNPQGSYTQYQSELYASPAHIQQGGLITVHPGWGDPTEQSCKVAMDRS